VKDTIAMAEKDKDFAEQNEAYLKGSHELLNIASMT
jgi:hypothetical protein